MSFIAWRGPSPITGDPLVLVVTGPSHNAKTGPMYQAWLLVEGQSPFEALRTKADAGICGDCVHRSGERRTCYVSMFNGPRQIWNLVQLGRYPTLTATEGANELSGQMVRVTAYGDPAFVPFETWDTLLSKVSGWAGYTHQWRTCDPRFRALLMASVETADEADEATDQGWRTFRARATSEPLRPREFACPASDEGGHKSTCARCQLCRGTSSPAKSVSILLHGKGAAAWTGPRVKYGGLRADLQRQGVGDLRLSAEQRSRVILALRMFYRRRKQTVTLRSKQIGDGIYRFWLDAMREVRQ